MIESDQAPLVIVQQYGGVATTQSTRLYYISLKYKMKGEILPATP